ncbi:MAG TPA: hypothetical protein VGI92_07770 [Gemmatimonadales bacterium]|jgi:hypothetical protein
MIRIPGVILLCAAASGIAGCTDNTAPVASDEAQYISAKRAWRPGERDSLVNAIETGHLWIYPFIGDISFYAAQILSDTDSVTMMIPNPKWQPSSDQMKAGPKPEFDAMGVQWNAGWNIIGVDDWSINNTQVPADTVRWVGVFWNNPAELSWKGLALVSTTRTATAPQTSVNTTAFNAAFGKAGAAAAEVRFSDGTDWEGNGPGVAPVNTIIVTSAAYGATSPVTTGPFLGGTQANGTMQGRLRQIPITRVSGPTGPTPQTVDFDFSASPIGAIQFICKFNNPCTTNH